ncbi:cytidylyltransferase domain-containing protein [Desulfofustis glycolicus]|uniref:acylneuraminate cytidylyltransferase family protein n=1 Tax=Desulfofustis glycolicus TaxID=51195 RepID=UPI0013793C29|nr:acylneuraminate cytidylyltransferase family protein [Desulfofustis glycolicus]MCB2216862.1 acylneuraminate cytidylyltransferase family protein [Desulfobulbaceae bacterium]
MVPARGGSKGIKLKNLREVGGVPLVAIVGRLLNGLPEIDRAVVSTDHELIRDVAVASGLEAPFLRPENLSGDRIGDLEVLTHALLAAEDDDGQHYDVVVMVQPTCPLRKKGHILDPVEKLIRGGYDAVWTVSPTDSKAHPLKQLVYRDDRLDYYDHRGASIIARQQLEPLYHRNGAAYAISRTCLLEKKSIKGGNTSAIVIEEFLPNIDTELDLQFADFYLNRLPKP